MSSAATLRAGAPCARGGRERRSAETAFKPNDESKPSEPAHVSNKPKWTDYVKSVYAKLQGDDPETTFKQAMSHAKATYK